MDDLRMLSTVLAEPDPSDEMVARSRHRLQNAMRGSVRTRGTGRLAGGLGRPSFKIALAACSTALVAGVGTAVFSAAGPSPHARQTTIQPVTLSADTTLRTDLENTFPRHLVAAGHTAVAAYHMGRAWYLYDPASGTYEKTPWTYLNVAPGMHQAAVLEGPLPASRVGILDMKAQKVTRWISVAHPVAGISWSPDGRRLLLTAYDTSPDVPAAPGISSRTGYYMLEAGSWQGRFRPLPADRNSVASRQDLGWSRNGTLIWSPTDTVPTKIFYDLNGHPHAAPAYEAAYTSEEAGLSPNGTLLPKFGPRPGPAVTVKNVTTGKAAAVLPIEQAVAWADDAHLFAIGCDVKKCGGKGEFHNRLLLVSLEGRITPLTGYHRSDQPASWVPLFTHR
jgi:hypothetical protein